MKTLDEMDLKGKEERGRGGRTERSRVSASAPGGENEWASFKKEKLGEREQMPGNGKKRKI